MKKIIIVGSSRNKGETQIIAQKLAKIINCEIINLNDYRISYFDYESNNQTDDYLKLMENLSDNYDMLIFATPVYWYSMSGVMKVFFDRLTDLLTIKKEIGKKLRTKKMAVITSSIGNNLGNQFWLPFIKTSEYLGMDFLGGLHTVSGKENDIELEAFVSEIIEKRTM